MIDDATGQLLATWYGQLDPESLDVTASEKVQARYVNFDAWKDAEVTTHDLRGPAVVDRILDTIRLTTQQDTAASTHLFAGFPGTGKTTDLGRLARELREYPRSPGFSVLRISAKDYHPLDRALCIEEMAILLAAGIGEAALKTLGETALHRAQEIGIWANIHDRIKRLLGDPVTTFKIGPLDIKAALFRSIEDTDRHQNPSATTLWDQIKSASTPVEARTAAGEILLTLIADAHAGLVTAPGLNPHDLAATLASLRVHNRWLSLHFAPRVERVLAHGPMADHPGRHALLLTYGLIQYPTSWQWPDCAHWQAWMSSPPPEHWLPAHLWHLVRSIQDPSDPRHRAHASEALERNDWPDVAQSLRDNTVVPTPPEYLARFDRGDSDHGSSPKTRGP